MVELRALIFVVVFMALILGANGEKKQRLRDRRIPGGFSPPCTNTPETNPFLPPCTTTPAVTAELTTTADAGLVQSTSNSNANSSQPSSLERAHWCRFNNGTYVSLGYSFIYNSRSLCQCLTSRAIRCEALQCMPTYCIDNTMPSVKSGQICTQCGYEVVTNSCLYNGIAYPHGVIMKVEVDQMQCWCQLGNIECRTYLGSIYDGLASSSVIFIVVAIVCVILIFGFVLCCACTLFSYYYFRRNQATFQQAYDQYANSAGWQPMGEDEQQVVDPTAEEKRIEAEKNELNQPTNDLVPPPYAVYNNSYVPEEVQKQI